jgi:hypothetical protein
MAEAQPPGWLQSAGVLHPAVLYRRMLSSFLGEGVGQANGNGDLKVIPDSPASMNVKIQSGTGFVQGDDVAGQGLYTVYNDATVTKSIAAAHATLDRIDLVVAHVKDLTVDGTQNDTWGLEVITGTAAGSPSQPATPNSAMPLASIRVRAASTSVLSTDITGLRIIAPLLSGNTGSPAVRIEKTDADQTLADATDTAISFNNVKFDATPSFYSGANPTRLTVPAAGDGTYLVTAQAMLEESADSGHTGSRRNVKLWKGAVGGGTCFGQFQQALQLTNFSLAYQPVINLSALIKLVAGDYVQASAFQDAGNTRHILKGPGGGTYTWLSMAKVS